MIELIAIIAVTILLMPLVLLTTGPLRFALGAVFLLFFPGYSLLAVLFPRKNSLSGIERIVLSFVLSFAIVSLIALILNYTPWGIRLEPIFIAIASFNLATSMSALIRRMRLHQNERFETHLHVIMPRWGRRSLADNALSVLLLLSILGAIGALIYVVSSPEAEESFTDFFILGPEGTVQDYPRELDLGKQTEVRLGVVNHEQQYADYSIEIRIDGEKMQEIGPISLGHGEDWQGEVNLVPRKAGESQKVEFLLYKGEESEPYLTLFLWLDVKET